MVHNMNDRRKFDVVDDGINSMFCHFQVHLLPWIQDTRLQCGQLLFMTSHVLEQKPLFGIALTASPVMDKHVNLMEP